MSEQEKTPEQKPTEKTFSQKDIEAERAHAQHFKTQYEDANTRLKNLETELSTLKNDKVAKAGDPKALEDRIKEVQTEIETRFSGKLSETETRAEKAERELKNLRVVKESVQTALGLGFHKGATKILEGVAQDNLDWQDGRIVVKGDDGKPLYSKANPRELMTAEEFFKDYADQNPFLVEATTRSGTMSGENKTGTSKGGLVRPPPNWESFTIDQKQDWMTKNPESAKALMRGQI